MLSKTSSVSEIIKINGATGTPTPWVLREQIFWFASSLRIQEIIKDFSYFFDIQLISNNEDSTGAFVPNFYSDYPDDYKLFSDYLTVGPFFNMNDYKFIKSPWYLNTVSKIKDISDPKCFTDKFKGLYVFYENISTEPLPLVENQKIGFVYLISNELMPDKWKIGFTNREPRLRAAELTLEAALSEPFIVDLALVTTNAEHYEEIIHKELRDIRHAKEFFNRDLSKAASAFLKYGKVSKTDTHSAPMVFHYNTKGGALLENAHLEEHKNEEVRKNEAVIREHQAFLSERKEFYLKIISEDLRTVLFEEYKTSRASQRVILEKAQSRAESLKNNFKTADGLGWAIFLSAFFTYGITLLLGCLIYWVYYPNKEKKLAVAVSESKKNIDSFDSETSKYLSDEYHNKLDEILTSRIIQTYTIAKSDSDSWNGFLFYGHTESQKPITFFGYVERWLNTDTAFYRAAYTTLKIPFPGLCFLRLRIISGHIKGDEILNKFAPKWLADLGSQCIETHYADVSDLFASDEPTLYKNLLEFKYLYSLDGRQFYEGQDKVSPFPDSFYQSSYYIEMHLKNLKLFRDCGTVPQDLDEPPF